MARPTLSRIVVAVSVRKERLVEQGLSEVFAGLDVEEISLDEEGRVVISNPQVAECLQAMAAKPKPPQPNGNCGVCNTVRGCHPTNSVPNCGCSMRA